MPHKMSWSKIPLFQFQLANLTTQTSELQFTMCHQCNVLLLGHVWNEKFVGCRHHQSTLWVMKQDLSCQITSPRLCSSPWQRMPSCPSLPFLVQTFLAKSPYCCANFVAWAVNCHNAPKFHYAMPLITQMNECSTTIFSLPEHSYFHYVRCKCCCRCWCNLLV